MAPYKRGWNVNEGDWVRVRQLFQRMAALEIPSLTISASGVLVKSATGDITLTFGDGLENSTGTLVVKVKALGGVLKDSDGLYVDTGASGFVPYTGASTTLNLGSQILTTTGRLQGSNLRTDSVTNHTVFVGDLSGGSGTFCVFVGDEAGRYTTVDRCIGVGYSSLKSCTGQYCTGIGHTSLQSNTGVNCSGVGYLALVSNTGDYCSGVGESVLQSNTGDYCTGFGQTALQSNSGGGCSGFGLAALQQNTGNNCIGFGYHSLYRNTGEDSVGFGSFTLKHNNSDNNTALGYQAFATWTADTGNAEDIGSLDPGTERVTITGHSFGGTGVFVNLKISTDGTLPTGLSARTYQWEVIDANTLELKDGAFSDSGSGTHTLTPRFNYTNSTAIGYQAEPDASNQVMLGDSNVTAVKSTGKGIFDGVTIGSDSANRIDIDMGTTNATFSGDITISANGFIVSHPSDNLSIGNAAGTKGLIVDGVYSIGQNLLTNSNVVFASTTCGTIQISGNQILATSGDMVIQAVGNDISFSDNNLTTTGSVSCNAVTVNTVSQNTRAALYLDGPTNRVADVLFRSAGDTYWILRQTVVALGNNFFLERHTGTGENIVDSPIEVNFTTGLVTLATGVAIGDGTNDTLISSTGDLTFTGTAGLAFGEIYARDNTTTTSTSTTKTQILIFDTDGVSNNMTPDHAQDHITVVKAGMYKIDASISIKNSSGSAHVISVEMYKNNGTGVFNNIHAGRTLGTGTDVGNLTMSGIGDLAVDDTIEFWITSDSGAARTVTVEDINFCALQIGGT